MKLKRCLSMLLAVALVVCMMPQAAFAEGAMKTFKYVALGDSITSGYGLTPRTGIANMDRALILTDELIANPITEAYPMVFGEKIKELGQKEGVTTQATNLATTAYRAQDVEKTIREACKGEVAELVLESFVGEGSSDILLHYHDIFEKYLPEADLVSIELGGNDIVMGVLVPMLTGENPILQAFSLSFALTLMGENTETALGGGLQLLISKKDQITYSSIVDAAKQLMEVGENADAYVKNAADQVEGVVKATKEKNPNADIALLGMFNPYEVTGDGSEETLQEKINTLISGCLRESAKLINETPEAQSDEVFCQALSDAVDESETTGDGDNAGDDNNTDDDADVNKSLDKFLEILKGTGLSIINHFAAESVEPQMLALNEYTKGIAEKYNATYVDVWGISTGNDSDPHPDAQGHKEIAERMYATLSNQIADAMKNDLVFTDVDETTDHEADIYWLAKNGISEGWKLEDGTAEFRPYSDVARADMAAFLYRLATKWGLADKEWQPQGTASFTDVDESTAHYREIMWLAENGISEGWKLEDGTAEFRPYANVARADMAAFLHRLQLLCANPAPNTGGASFTDVDESTPHHADILWLANNGISTGWKHEDETAEFRPYANVARADMAAFLHRMDALA